MDNEFILSKYILKLLNLSIDNKIIIIVNIINNYPIIEWLILLYTTLKEENIYYFILYLYSYLILNLYNIILN